ncbi:hypothetical protein GUITHDRAFT_163176, partial [Guillardia theta CCMP2712]
MFHQLEQAERCRSQRATQEICCRSFGFARVDCCRYARLTSAASTGASSSCCLFSAVAQQQHPEYPELPAAAVGLPVSCDASSEERAPPSGSQVSGARRGHSEQRGRAAADRSHLLRASAPDHRRCSESREQVQLLGEYPEMHRESAQERALL